MKAQQWALGFLELRRVAVILVIPDFTRATDDLLDDDDSDEIFGHLYKQAP